jgi:hypothetical protein
VKRKADASPAEPPLITLKGRTFQLHQWNSQDHREFELWMRQRYIAAARDMAQGLPEASRMELYQYAVDRAAQIGPFSADAASVMASIEGAAKALWFSVRKEHPDMTEEEVAELLSDRETLERVADQASPRPARKPKPKPRT